MRINGIKKDPLKIIFEKHLFGGEFLTAEALESAVLNYYFEYLEQSQMIIRIKDLDEIKEEIREEIIELITKTIGLEKNIKKFLKALDNLEERKVKSHEKYIELYIELEEEFGI
jgi:predicted transcriptional regulator